MKTQTKYLRITLKSLMIRYGAIYIALAMSIVFSRHSPLLFTIGYWVIFGTLMVVERIGSYVQIREKQLIWRSWFFFRLTIPTGNIHSLEKGEFYGIGHPECILLKFKLSDGRESIGYILPSQYRREDIKMFVNDLSRTVPQLVVDKNIEKWI